MDKLVENCTCFFDENFIEIVYDKVNHMIKLCGDPSKKEYTHINYSLLNDCKLKGLLFISLTYNENIHYFPMYEFEMCGEDIIPFLDKLAIYMDAGPIINESMIERKYKNAIMFNSFCSCKIVSDIKIITWSIYIVKH